MQSKYSDLISVFFGDEIIGFLFEMYVVNWFFFDVSRTIDDLIVLYHRYFNDGMAKLPDAYKYLVKLFGSKIVFSRLD